MSARLRNVGASRRHPATRVRGILGPCPMGYIYMCRRQGPMRRQVGPGQYLTWDYLGAPGAAIPPIVPPEGLCVLLLGLRF